MRSKLDETQARYQAERKYSKAVEEHAQISMEGKKGWGSVREAHVGEKSRVIREPGDRIRL